MEIQDLLNNVYYSTLRQIANDLVKQIEDIDNYYSYNKPSAKVIKENKNF